jgi:hypothetical protein
LSSASSPEQQLRYSLSGPEGRRSTRVERILPIVVLGQTKTGLSFQEKTSTVSFNLHGCRYPTRHEYSVGTPIGLRVLEPDGESISPIIRAFVKSVHPPGNPRELCQVGVELEAPANIWNLSPAPADWNRLLTGSGSSAGLATAVAPALEAPTSDSANSPPPGPFVAPPASEQRTAQVTPFPVPPPAAARIDAAKDAAVSRPERVAITIDQLVTAMQGKLQVAAEKVIQSALSMHLDQAVKNAVAKLEDARAAQALELEQSSTLHFESLMRAARLEILGHLESRLGEVQSRWEEQHNAFRSQAEEIAQRLEIVAADTQRNLAETQKFIEQVGRSIEPQTRNRVDESVGQMTEKFEAAADRISDRQLVRVMEATRMVMREAAAQLDARVAESRALVNGAANNTLEEFRRQAEVQVDLAATETTERVKSALGALDAENRALCESRRRAMIEEISRTTEQSTEQFRSGMKAFLYSCLVAAVGAVDEHAKATLDNLVKAPATPRTISDGVIPPPEDEKPN